MLVTLGFLISAVTSAQGGSAIDAPQWRWFVTCSRPAATRLHVTLRGKSLFDATVPVCRIPEAERSEKADHTILTFHFRGDPSWFDSEAASVPGTPIEGSIWQAGGEAYGMLLGVSFLGRHQVLLNTIHIAKADEYSSAPVANGIVVSTGKFRARMAAEQKVR